MTDDETLSLLANALVTVPDDMKNGAQKGRLLATILLREHSDYIETCVENRDFQSIPYFELVDASNLPSGEIAVLSTARDQHPVYQVAAAANEADLKSAIAGVFDAIKSAKLETNGNNGRKSFKRAEDAVGSAADSLDFHGSRTPIEYGEPIKKTTRLASTSGDHYRGRNLHNAEEGTSQKADWRYEQKIVLDDKNNIPPHDWLRQLRLLSGKKIQDMSIALGIEESSGSAYSKYENNQWPLTAKRAHAILEKNLLDLPIDPETQKVREDIRVKFLQKFGHFAGTDEQLANAIKAIVIDHARHIAHGGKPDDSITATLTADENSKNGHSRHHMLLELIKHRNSVKGVKNGKSISVSRLRKEKPELEIPKNADYLNLLPFSDSDNKILKNNKEVSDELAKSLVFEIAEHAPTLSVFLNRYQQIHSKNMKAIGKVLGVSKNRVSQILNQEGSLSAGNLPHGNTTQPRMETIQNIIEKNAFDLPAGEDGKIYPEVLDAIWKLHRKEKYKSPYVDLVNAAQEAFIIPRGQTSWVSTATNPYHQPEYTAWVDYWRELGKQEKESGKIKIGENHVRSWRNAEGHLLIHKDDIILLEESARYRTLIKEAKQQQAGQSATL